MGNVTNVNNGGTVHVQAGNSKNDKNDGKDRNTEVVNVNNGGTVGIQAGTVSGNTVVITGW